MIRNVGQVRFIALVPSDVGNKKEDLLSLEDNVALFDFYTFFGLMPKKSLELRNQFIQVGTLRIRDGSITPEISDEYKKEYSVIQLIEKCMSEKEKEGTYFPETHEQRLEYSIQVNRCVSKLLEKELSKNVDDWVCIACGTLNKMENLACSECGLPRDVSIEAEPPSDRKRLEELSRATASTDISTGSKRKKVNRKPVEDILED